MAKNKEVVLQWTDPPAVKRGQRESKFDPTIESLKENPGNWALVLEDVNSASARIFAKKGCKITTRSTGEADEDGKSNGRVNVWAMFPDGDTPEDSTPDSPSPSKPKAKKKAPAKKGALKRVAPKIRVPASPDA